MALLLIDVINAFEFPGAERLLAQALPVAAEIARLRRAAHADCVASLDPEENAAALRQMKKVLKADVSPWRKIKLER